MPKPSPGWQMPALRTHNRIGLLLAAVLLAPGLAPITLAAKEHQPLQPPFRLGLGAQQYNSRCASCHGIQGGGTDEGPPLIHPYYKPSHHSDRAFVQAIQAGSQQHHWKFGDMPAIHELLPGEIRQVVDFVRWMQQQKGLN